MFSWLVHLAHGWYAFQRACVNRGLGRLQDGIPDSYQEQLQEF